jgi:hypothetical protein
LRAGRPRVAVPSTAVGGRTGIRHRRASPELGETLDEEVLVWPEVDIEQRDVVRLVDPV